MCPRFLPTLPLPLPPGPKKWLRSQGRRDVGKEREAIEKMGTWTHSWCELYHVPSEDHSNTTPGHLFCNTYGNVCATEHGAETQTLCEDRDDKMRFLLWCLQFTPTVIAGSLRGCLQSKKGLLTYKFMDHMSASAVYNVQNSLLSWYYFKGLFKQR